MKLKDLNSISISSFVSNHESTFGGGWKSSNSTAENKETYLENICNFPEDFSLFLDCLKKNTFDANEIFAEVIVNEQQIDMDNLSPQLYDIWFSKFHVLNHSFSQENESITIKYNNNENFEHFIISTSYVGVE